MLASVFGAIVGGIGGALEMLLLAAAVVAAYWLSRWALERAADKERSLRLTGLVAVAAGVALGVLVGGDQRLRAVFYFVTLLGVPATLGQIPPDVFAGWLNRLVGSAERKTP